MVDHFSLYIPSPGYHWGARPLSAGSPVTLHRALPPQLMNPYLLGCKFFFVSYGVLMCAGKRTLLVWWQGFHLHNLITSQRPCLLTLSSWGLGFNIQIGGEVQIFIVIAAIKNVSLQPKFRLSLLAQWCPQETSLLSSCSTIMQKV